MLGAMLRSLTNPAEAEAAGAKAKIISWGGKIKGNESGK